MQELDAFILMPDTFDSDSAREDLLLSGKRALLLTLNSKGISFSRTSSDPSLFIKPLHFFWFKSQKLNYLFYPVLFILQQLQIFFLFLSIRLRFRIKTMVINYTYAAWIGAAMRKLGLVKKMIYSSGDWLAGDKTKKGIWSYMGSEVIFPFFDYWSCRWSDITLNCTQAIGEARFLHWGRKISKKEITYQPKLRIKNPNADLNKLRKNIAFLGNVREDSGLEIALQAIGSMRREVDVVFKILGTNVANNNFLNNMIHKYNADKYIALFGFVERSKFGEVLDDCFCGINLILSQDSYTSKTLPSKIFDYLQFLMPVIVTKNVGPVVEIIKMHKLGLVIEPTEEQFLEAADEKSMGISEISHATE